MRVLSIFCVTLLVLLASGFDAGAGTPTPIPCDAGFFNPDTGNQPCTPCPPGRFASGEAATTCDSCPRGRFQDQEAQTTCKNCPQGRFADAMGLSTCERCAVGTFADVEGLSTCIDCRIGTFTDKQETINCDPCPLGKFQSSEGKTFCQNCPLGRFADVTGSSICRDCREGTYAGAQGLPECAPCPLGQFGEETGLSTCRDCNAGTFADEQGLSTCLDCNSGTAQPLEGQDTCPGCPPGFFADSKGLSTCTACFPGTAQPELGRSTCPDCAAGTFADSSGSLFCEACPSGEFSENTGSISCERCSEGEYRPFTLPGDSCAVCPAFGATCTGGEITADAGFWVYDGEVYRLRFWAHGAASRSANAGSKRGPAPPPVDLFGSDRGDGNLRVVADAAPGTPEDPLLLAIELDAPLLAARTSPELVELTYQGATVEDCIGTSGVSPDPCVSSREPNGSGLRINVKATEGGEFALLLPARCAPLALPDCERAAKEPILVIVDGKETKDKLTWIWPKGEDSIEDLGDPVGTDHHSLCVYEASGNLIAQSRVVASDDCDGNPCWKAKPSAPGEVKGKFLFKDKTGAADGVSSMQLKSDARGRKTLNVKAKGPGIRLAAIPLELPLSVPVSVQLQSSNGACWESTFDEAGVKKSDERVFKAKGF